MKYFTDREDVALVIAALVVGLIAFDGILCVIYAIRRQAITAGKSELIFAEKWSLVDPWIAAHLLLAAFIPVIFVIGVALALTGQTSINEKQLMESLPIVGLITLVQFVLLTGLPIFFITAKYGVPIREIGLRKPTRKPVSVGLMAGFGVLIFSHVLEWMMILLLTALVGPENLKHITDATKNLTAEKYLTQRMSFGVFIGALIAAGVLAPISEEIFFRGFLFNCAKRRLGIVGGIILTSAIFALVHLGPLAIMIIFPMGIFLALAYELTGSLWVPIIMHAVNNSIAVTAAYLMTSVLK